MSRRSQKRKLYDKHHERAVISYNNKYNKWRLSEPPRWRIFAWLEWRKKRPNKPKDAVEYDEMFTKYGRWRDRWTSCLIRLW